VFRAQINPGSTALGTPQVVTQTLDPLDGTETTLTPSKSLLGAAARGTSPGVTSRLYVSFTSSMAAGTYKGFSAPKVRHTALVLVVFVFAQLILLQQFAQAATFPSNTVLHRRRGFWRA